MKKVIILLFLSVIFIILTIGFKFVYHPILLLVGFLTGIINIYFSIRLLVKKNDNKRAILLSVAAVLWGVVCLFGILSVSRSGVRFVLKKYILDTYDQERIYFVFEDYIKRDCGGYVNLSDNWRSVLSKRDWYVRPSTFNLSEKGRSWITLNKGLIGKNINELPDDIVLFFEMDDGNLAIASKEDFLSQDWESDQGRLIILANGRSSKYYKLRGGFQFFNTETQKVGYKALKWE